MAQVKGGRAFDEADLLRTLRALPPSGRAVFAACCAERLWPALRAFVGVTELHKYAMREALNTVWSRSSAAPIGTAGGDLSEACVPLVPSEADGWAEGQAYAEDGAAAIVYALRTLQHGRAEDAAWAARRAHDAVDYLVENELAGADDQEGTHALVSAELARQARDLEELATYGASQGDLALHFRHRAEAEAEGVFASAKRWSDVPEPRM